MARAWLTDRKVLSLTGSDRAPFLQGLVSNDITQAGPGVLVWAAFLTPQGRYLADFFVWHEADHILLDVSAAQSDLLRTKLARFRLRADVQITETDLTVQAFWNGETNGSARPDPRLATAGERFISSAPESSDGSGLAAYDAHRLSLGLPSPEDCEPEKTLLLEANFDWLNGISWKKGCYMGQELTARTHYRGLVKKRLVPLRAESAFPPCGTILHDGEREIGQIRTSSGGNGLAFLRREYWTKPVQCEGLTLTPHLPDWFRIETP